MKLAVLGATGRTGGLLLTQALAAGHEVRALVRDPTRLADRDHPALTVLQGDACDEADVGRLLAGAEVVLMALGHTPTSTPDVLERAAGHVVHHARAQEVRRVVALTSGSVAHPQDRPTLGHRALVAIADLLYRARFADARRQAETLRASGLEVVLVRATRLCDDPGEGEVRAGYLDGRVEPTVPRADVAAFMLQQIDSQVFVGEVPMVSRRA